MFDECPMAADCPGYDRDRRMCPLRREDCEFSTADGGASAILEILEPPTPDADGAAT